MIFIFSNLTYQALFMVGKWTFYLVKDFTFPITEDELVWPGPRTLPLTPWNPISPTKLNLLALGRGWCWFHSSFYASVFIDTSICPCTHRPPCSPLWRASRCPPFNSAAQTLISSFWPSRQLGVGQFQRLSSASCAKWPPSTQHPTISFNLSVFTLDTEKKWSNIHWMYQYFFIMIRTKLVFKNNILLLHTVCVAAENAFERCFKSKYKGRDMIWCDMIWYHMICLRIKFCCYTLCVWRQRIL